MRLIDFGAWPSSWSGVEDRVARKLRRHGWRLTGRHDDLMEYRDRDKRLIRVSFLGYMLADDDVDVERFDRLIGGIWRHGTTPMAVDRYPQARRLTGGGLGRVALLLADNASRQLQFWLSHSLYGGVVRRRGMLISRCLQVERLHPAADRKAWERLAGSIERDGALIDRRAVEEFTADGLQTVLAAGAVILAPMGLILSEIDVFQGVGVRTMGLILVCASAFMSAGSALIGRIGP